MTGLAAAQTLRAGVEPDVRVPARWIDGSTAMAGGLDGFQKAYFQAFCLVSFACWSPFNALAYAAPFLAILWILVRTQCTIVLRRVFVWTLAWALLIFAHVLANPHFQLPNALLAFLTYGAAAFLISMPSHKLYSPSLLTRMVSVLMLIVAVEAALGTFQACYGYLETGSFDLGNGDFVEGTIHPQLAPERSMSNPIFAANMAIASLALLPFAATRARRLLVIAGLCVLVLASVVHMLILLCAALVMAFVACPPGGMRSNRMLAVGLLVVPVFSFMLLQSNLTYAPNLLRATMSLQTPRGVAAYRAAVEIPRDHELSPLVGLGPGQFSSRAGLVSTGLYFADMDQLEGPLGSRMARPFRRYVLDLWTHASRVSTGSSFLPFSSWLSVIGEFGWLALALVLSLALIFVARVGRLARRAGARSLGTSTSAIAIFLLLLGCYENYWEIPQAILPGCFLLLAFHGVLRSQARLTEGRESGWEASLVDLGSHPWATRT